MPTGIEANPPEKIVNKQIQQEVVFYHVPLL
jgi:hypothetical protein